jgi:hypothetical protein
MTFAEIGRRHGLTRARVHQAVVKALGILGKTWGPRIPRLLEMMRAHCVSIPNGSRPTPALLERLVGDASKSVSLSPEAQLRLIAALDKNTPVDRKQLEKEIAHQTRRRRIRSEKAEFITLRHSVAYLADTRSAVSGLGPHLFRPYVCDPWRPPGPGEPSKARQRICTNPADFASIRQNGCGRVGGLRRKWITSSRRENCR